MVHPSVLTDSALVLANDSPGASAMDCRGLLHDRVFSPLHDSVAGDSSHLLASIQGRLYLNESLTAAAAEAVSVRGILRSVDAHVDRSQVMVAYQLHDSHGNVRVMTQGLAVDFALSASGLSSVTASCSVSLLANTHYLGSCVLRCATYAL